VLTNGDETATVASNAAPRIGLVRVR
jgi:hypothetical protein